MFAAGGLMWVFWLALVAGIVLLVVRGDLAGGAMARPPHDTALELLKQRYARGEIDEREYHRRRRMLGS